jgi:hypothetical protein
VLDAYPVGDTVNNSQNDGPELVNEATIVEDPRLLRLTEQI